MLQSRPRNRFKTSRLSGPTINKGFTSTGYYMWDMKNEDTYSRNSYGAAVCTAEDANKRSGGRNYSGVYYERGKCFVMLYFVDERFRTTRR